MGVMRTALAVGALLVSVPLMAQPGRDRPRADRGGDARGGRTDNRSGGRTEPRNDNRAGRRDDGRNARPGGDMGGGRVEPRSGGTRVEPRGRTGGDPRGGGNRYDPRGSGSRYDPRGGMPTSPRGRVDRRDEPRIAVRPPVVIDRYDHRRPRVVPPPVRYGRPLPYRYGDHDFRERELFAIRAWFYALPPARLTAYGFYGPGYGGIRYAFRPGIYLSMAVFGQLGLLPYELELELGELPWYLERRIYGDTVLVIDTRTRLVVDIFEVDY